LIQAQVGHVSPMMMRTYSHIRSRALSEAAAAPEPTPVNKPTESSTPDCAITAT
jgi:hypothetical protein